MLLEETLKFRMLDEAAAKSIIEEYRQKSGEKGYVIKKAGYERKTKKSKGEIIAEIFVVTITMTYGDMWEDIV